MIKKLLLILMISTVMFGQQTMLKKANHPVKDLSHEYYRNFDRMMIDKELEKNPDFLNKRLLRKTTTEYQVGDTVSWFANDSGLDGGTIYQTLSTCRAVTENCYVFVEDAVWGSDVNQNSVDAIATAFSDSTPADPTKGIYDIDTEIFGPPFDIDNNPHIFLFVLNIRDAYYYNPGVGVYTGGYHSAYNSTEGDQSNVCEMFYIDCDPSDLLTEEGLADVNATIAHEFQHMIQAAAHILQGVGALDQVTFYDEGCSEAASVICGYPGRASNYYMDETNIKLETWRDNDDAYDPDEVLHDYERAFRFMLYAYEQHGSSLLTAFTTATNPMGAPKVGKDAFEQALGGLSPTVTFKQYLENWFLASVIDDASVDPKWNFTEDIIEKVSGESISAESSGSYDIQAGGAQVLRIASGSNITVNFTMPSQYAPNYVKIKAVKDYGTSMEVVDVDPNTDVHFADFGTAFTKIQFVIYSSAGSSAFEVQYTVTGTVSDVEDESTIPTEYSLNQNYPNPFNPTTNISYTIPESGNVTLAVYDVLGNMVTTLVNEDVSSGTHNVSWNGKDVNGVNVSSGIYFYTIKANNFVQTKKMMLIK